MKKITVFFFLVIFSKSFSQDIPSVEKIHLEFNKSSTMLNIRFSIPKSDSYILIENDIALPRDLFVKPCSVYKLDLNRNNKAKKILKDHSLLKDIYILLEEELVRLESKDASQFYTSNFYLELSYKSDDLIRNIILPVIGKEKAKKVLNEFEQLLLDKKCFKLLEIESRELNW